VDDRAGRIGEPISLRFGVRGDPRLATIDLAGEDEHPVVPVGQVPQHTRDRPVLVGRRGEGIVVQPVDEVPETLARAVVDLDVRAIVSHHCLLPTVEPLNRAILSDDAESAGARIAAPPVRRHRTLRSRSATPFRL
jgi:hypothetical protein